jgi:protein-tyrosine phosphatase
MPTALHLDWPGLLNARDLGGLPVGGGGRIRERALVRSDNHSYLTDDGVAALRAYGVSRIVDLRGPHELEQLPSPLADDAAYRNLPVQDPGDPADEPTLAELYRGMLDRRPELFGAVMVTIAEAPEGAVAVHCAAGKDRTGLVVAMTLSLAGVPDEAIGADYAMTEQRMRTTYDELIANAPDDAERSYLQEVLRTVPTNVTAALAHLRARHGSVEAYLRPGGFTPAHTEVLVNRLVEG